MLATTLATAALCGVLPAIRAARHGLGSALHGVGRGQVSTRNSLQWLLVGAQVALSVTLLVGAGLLVRSFHALSRVNPGFEPSRVLTFRITGDWAETMDMNRLAQRLHRTIEELEALPGVEAAARTSSVPGVPRDEETTFELVEARGENERHMVAETGSVSPNYFATMQIPLLDGELCRHQTLGAARDLVVNQTFATRYLSGWPSPVGLHLKPDSGGSSGHRIVGVVGNARERGLHRAPGPAAYWCANWSPMPHFLVRTRGEPLTVAQAIRRKIKELDPLRSVYNISPLEERIGDAFTENRLRTALLVLFATTALSLACVGLYGTLSYAVSLRRREIGLRQAVGAGRRQIVWQFLLQGLRVAGVACLCGVAFSIALSRGLSSMLYGISRFDPLTLSSVVAIVLAVTVVASLLPAIRAARLDPMRVLREE
jgi:putative ABC transport system permease protein